jgi:hypothetical protein
MPGECWAFEGEGAVVIQLIGKVNITAVSIEHPVHGLLQTDAIKSAPKDFSVWVCVLYRFSSFICKTFCIQM